MKFPPHLRLRPRLPALRSTTMRGIVRSNSASFRIGSSLARQTPRMPAPFIVGSFGAVDTACAQTVTNVEAIYLVEAQHLLQQIEFPVGTSRHTLVFRRCHQVAGEAFGRVRHDIDLVISLAARSDQRVIDEPPVFGHPGSRAGKKGRPLEEAHQHVIPGYPIDQMRLPMYRLRRIPDEEIVYVMPMIKGQIGELVRREFKKLRRGDPRSFRATPEQPIRARPACPGPRSRGILDVPVQ